MTDHMLTFPLSYLDCLHMLTAGMLIGFLFFWSLWVTTSRGLLSPSPTVWFVFGFVIRMAATTGVFYLLSQGSGWRLVVMLVGFILARQISKIYTANIQETSHASES